LGVKTMSGLRHSAALAAQEMKILRGGGRLADVHVAFGGQLHESLDARAGMLGPWLRNHGK